MKITTVNPLEFSNWNRCIAGVEGSTFFHTSNWAQVLAETYDYKPVYFCAFQDGQLAGCIPVMDIRSIATGHRGVSLPFTDECHPLGREKDTIVALWDFAKSYGKKSGWRYLELRGDYPACNSNLPSESYYTHVLELAESAQDLLRKFRNSTKRNIEKAARLKVNVTHTDRMESMADFYNLLCITRKRHGLPPQPYKFFKKLQRYALWTKMGFILLVYHGGIPIAAALFLHFGRKVIYKFGASDKKHQKLRANNLIMWQAIQWAIQNGYTEFSFGRTSLHNSGLLQFKRGWRASEHLLAYYRYDFNKADFIKSNSCYAKRYPIIDKLPLPLLKFTGRLLYRHVG